MIIKYESIEEIFEDINNTKVSIILRIKWLYQRFIRSIRNIVRTPKWWYQRITRGYSDKDMWNADTYLAGVFSGVLQWYIDEGHGVSNAYAEGLDRYEPDVNVMVERRDEAYRTHISVFKEYKQNGLAYNEEWQKEFGGVLDKDIQASVQWLSEHFTELWD
jgi:hypothetical protein